MLVAVSGRSTATAQFRVGGARADGRRRSPSCRIGRAANAVGSGPAAPIRLERKTTTRGMDAMAPNPKTAPPLSQSDVERLLHDPSDDTRAELAGKLGDQFTEPEALSDKERALAEEIVRLMAADASELVRHALSENLKRTREIPHDVALTLARDVESVSLPILEFSEILTDADLIDLLDRAPESKQLAVARRDGLSDAVAQVLIEESSQEVVRTVVANPSAALTEQTLHRVVDRFGDDESIQDPLVHRAQLPVTVAEKLVARLSDSLQDYLVSHHELSTDTASELILRTRERATVNLVGTETDLEALEKLARQLRVSGRLSPSLILRAVCMGDLRFVELAFAELTGISLLNVRMLLHDAGPLGYRSLYKKAGLPERLLSIMREALAVALSTDVRGHDYDRDTFSRTVLERVLSVCDDLQPEDADYLLQKLDDLAPAEWHGSA